MRRNRLIACCSFAAALTVAGAVPSPAQPVLTDSLYDAHHPRLLFASAEIPALRAKVQDGGPDDGDYLLIRGLVQNNYPAMPFGSVLGEWYGLSSIPYIGLVGYIESPSDPDALSLGRALTLHIVNAYEPDFDEAASGARLRALALGYDMFFGDATPADRAAVRDEIVRYVQKMLWNTQYQVFEYRPYLGNHSAVFGAALGLAAIALQGEADGTLLSDAMAMADRIADNLLSYQFDPDGAYGEGDLYAAWTLLHLVYYFDARKRFDGYAYGDLARVRAVEQWFAYELLPEGYGRSHNLNDSPYATTPLARYPTYFEWAIHEWNSGLSSWLWDHTAGAYGAALGLERDRVGEILWYRPITPVQPGSVLPSGRVWLKRGLYWYRTGWPSGASSRDVAFSFFSGKFQGGHAQEDQNQFALYAYGEKFALDNGAGAAAKQSEAHNMVLIDGQGQHNAGSSIGTDGDIAGYLTGSLADYVVGDATAAYTTHSEFNDPGRPLPGTDWSWGYSGANPVAFALRRVIVVHGGDARPYFVIMDDIDKDGTPHDFEWRMHTLATNTVTTTSNPIVIAGQTAAMDVHLLNPAWGTVSVTTTPFDNGNADPASMVLRISRNAINPRFGVLLLPRDGGVPAPAVTNQPFSWGYACTVDWGAGIVDYVLRNNSGESVSFGPVQTDALIAMVRRVSGDVEGYIAIEAGSLKVGGMAYASIGDGAATCEMSYSTVSLDRYDAAFRFLDTGIDHVMYRDQELGFAVDGGYVVPGGVTAVGHPPLDRDALTLSAHPNPFNPETFIRVDGAPGLPVRVAVYDVAGRRIRTLWDAPLGATSRVLAWDGRSDAGSRVASGVYLLRAASPAGSRTLKLTLLK